MNIEDLADNLDCFNVVNLLTSFRKLWKQHISWTRIVLTSIMWEIEDFAYVNERLLQNPNSFATVFCTYYGRDMAAEFERLFTEHIVAGNNFAISYRQNNTVEIDKARKALHKNAEAISVFLNQYNPFWTKEKTYRLMSRHVKMSENQAVYMMSSQFINEINEYEMIENEAMEFADYFSEGIIRQFSNMFWRDIDEQ